MKTSLVIIFIILAVGVSYAKQHQVHGRVLSLTGLPIPGVNVIARGTSNGTVTDWMGNFKIVLPEGQAVLFFSYLRQKTLEHAITLRDGYQYQINVGLASRSQTFNKSYALTAELPLSTPIVTGMVTDQNGKPLGDVKITQRQSTFRTFSDALGNFSLPVPEGKNMLSFEFGGLKTLELPVDVKEGGDFVLDVRLVEDKNKYRKQNSFAKTLTQVNGK